MATAEFSVALLGYFHAVRQLFSFISIVTVASSSSSREVCLLYKIKVILPII